MRQIQFWPGHRESTKLGVYKMVFNKATSDPMQPSRQQQVLKKPKRFRSAFTTDQINYLEKQFKKFPYINREQRKEVATALKMEERPIKIWFQNRRMREKKESCKEFDDETSSHKPQECVKDQLHNVPAAPSTNDPTPYSLPIFTPNIDAKTYHDIKKTNKVEHKIQSMVKQKNDKVLFDEPKQLHPKANYYKEADDEEQLSPYFQRNPTCNTSPYTINTKISTPPPQESQHIKTSAEFSINLCKKYKKESVTSTPAANAHPIANQGDKANKLDNCDATANYYIKDAKSYRPPEVVSVKKPKLSHPAMPKPKKHVTMNSSTYYPVMPTIYAPPFMSGGVLWKPVNVMPVMAANGPPVTIPSSQGASQVQNKDCKCNCHASCTTQHIPLPPCLQNPYLHYNMYCGVPSYQS